MTDLKTEILYYSDEIKKFLSRLSESSLISDKETFFWDQNLEAISEGVSGHIVRIAVIGAVKSGKSTLVNALLGEDLLKRGSGIITSFVTRIRSSEKEKGGWVELKSWNEINDDITRTYREISLLNEEAFSCKDKLDIRRENDRRLIEKLLGEAIKERRSNRPVFDSQIMMIRAYLGGYDYLANSLDPDFPVRKIFNELSLYEHQIYTGSEYLWAFTRDLEIVFPVPWLGKGVEIADCQGADSPNPVHLITLQDYLAKCHGVVYVIQSRVGLREVDFRMLEVVRKFGLMPMTTVVINIDIGEHEKTDDFKRLHERIERELSWLGEDIPLFSLSALAEMVKITGGEARAGERDRVSLWKNLVPELYHKSEEEFSLLKEYLRENIVGSHEFFKRNYERLSLIVSRILDGISTYREMLDLDIRAVESIMEDLVLCESMIKSSLQTFEKTVSEFSDSTLDIARKTVLEFFNPHGSSLILEVKEAIDGYCCRNHTGITNFKQLLREIYEFYIEVREEIFKVIAERISSKIIDFSKTQENYVRDRITEVFHSLMSVFRIAFEGYRKVIYEKISFQVEAISCDFTVSWHPPEDLKPPPLVAFTREHAIGKTALVMKFGLGKMIETLSRFRDTLGRRRGKRSRSYAVKNHGDEVIRLVRDEVKVEIEELFEWYAERYINEYLIPLIDDGINWCIREVRLRTRASVIDFHRIVETVRLKGEERERQKKILEEAIKTLNGLFKDSF